MRHLIDPLDFSQEEITSLLDLADRIRSDPAAYQIPVRLSPFGKRGAFS